MSVRLFTYRLFNHGRYFLQNSLKRHIHINILERKGNGNIRGASANLRKAGQIANQPAIRNAGLFRFGQHARRLFVDNILNRVTTTYSADLRNEATKKLLYGDSAPFFSLIGVSLATGTGILTKDDELEGVCWEIREAVSRLQNTWGKEEISKTMNENFGLNDLDIGPPIAKGCAAVVYSAALKDPSKLNHEPVSSPQHHQGQQTQSQHEIMSPIQNTSRFLHNFGGSVDNVNFNTIDLDLLSASGNRSILLDGNRRQSITSPLRQRFDSITESKYEGVAGESDGGSHGNGEDKTTTKLTAANAELSKYPLALKMMFNYDIQSNAMSILRAMYKETIPARNKRINDDADAWEKLLMEQTVTLPPHPNIVMMFGVFCDQIPNLVHGTSLYPMALPPRINPQGYGRNMSLFLLMKRYNYRLCDYLTENDVSMRSRILIFAQLLEAVAHLYRYGVAHRDLKSDNILIDLNDDIHPVLVLSDFGCCLADKTHGLHLPYNSSDMDKGGNTALMAPEIINQVPGTFSILNYTKSDLWACGALSYEIFGHLNPFYGDRMQQQEVERAPAIRNSTYSETDLPNLGDDVPPIVRSLVENILQRNPRKRLSPDVAANVMQLFLWAPSAWLQPNGKPSSAEILQWLLSLTTKVLCDGRGGNTKFTENAFGYQMGRRTYTEYLLISSFLVRARLESVRTAMNWIQNVVS